MSTYIFTGRFQPLHTGHIALLEAFRERHPNEFLLICIIRQSEQHSVEPLNAFATVSMSKQQLINNPLPNWERYELLHLAIRNNDLLKNNTEIIFRERSDIDWQNSIKDLPQDRIWVLPSYMKETFDLEKYNYYKLKNERIELIQVSSDSKISATKIRESLRLGTEDYSFLPDVCVDYFKSNCSKFFKNN